MSLVDKVFGRIPGPLIKKWGMSGFYVKVGEPFYDTETGELSTAEQRIAIKLIRTELKAEDIKGEVQSTDVKILLAAEGLGDYKIQTCDKIEYVEAGETRIAKIIEPMSWGGERQILHALIIRFT